MKKFESLQLQDGSEAINLVANLNDGIKKAVVTLPVLQYLIGLLPSADISTIMKNFRDKLRTASYNNPTMEEFVNMLQEELDFHKSVNLIQEYFTPEQPYSSDNAQVVETMNP